MKLKNTSFIKIRDFTLVAQGRVRPVSWRSAFIWLRLVVVLIVVAMSLNSSSGLS